MLKAIENEKHKELIVVILAGGGGHRMGGIDKGEVMLGHQRLIDHVIERMTPQADRVLISSVQDYDTGLTAVEDRDDGPRGPAAGLWAVAQWMKHHLPKAAFFVSVPADGPYVPKDLVARLTEAGECTFATDDNGDHPTFACWDVEAVINALGPFAGKGVALREIVQICHARPISFTGETQLMNINTKEELARAAALLPSVD